MKKLIPALALLLVSAVMLATSSFAWFSMNTSVTVTGMSVKTSVGDNLLIAPAEGTGTAAMPAANAYRSQVSNKIDAKLEPVSSVNGQNGSFYYTSVANVDSAGDAASEAYVLYNEATALANTNANKTNVDSDFNANYAVDTPTAGTAVYGYVDYVFALQATNTQASANRYLNLTKCDLNYDGSTEYTGKAFRVAVLLQECTAADTANTTVTTKTILSAGAAADYFVSGKAISTTNAAPSVDVTALNTQANLATIAAGETKYYKVTVRLWLEGEDKSCNNETFATLDAKWTLDLKFALVDAVGGVSALTKTNATQYTIGTSATNVPASDKTIGGTTFYAYTATTPSGTIYGNLNTGAGNVTRWFNITGSDVYEITEFVTVE